MGQHDHVTPCMICTTENNKTLTVQSASSVPLFFSKL